MLASRYLKRTNPNSQFLKPLPSSNIFAAALTVLGLILLTIARELYPTSRLGSFLQSPVGIIAASITWLLIASYLGALFFGPKGKNEQPGK
jgi:hypothetical protein